MNNSPYRCTIYGNPTSCNCASCAIERRLRASREAIKAAKNANLSRPPVPRPKNLDDFFVSPKESPREKIERQRRERFAESDKTWAYVQANEGRYAVIFIPRIRSLVLWYVKTSFTF